MEQHESGRDNIIAGLSPRGRSNKAMDFQTLRRHLLNHPGAYEDRPFGPQALVFKVMGKMFALVPLTDDRNDVTLKCDPVLAELLRNEFPEVRPAYHMNKRHWNMIDMDGDIPDGRVFEMIDDSYALVVKGLKKADREKLARGAAPPEAEGRAHKP